MAKLTELDAFQKEANPKLGELNNYACRPLLSRDNV
jgi:hypothetical protein